MINQMVLDMARLRSENAALRSLAAQLAEALEYHQEQTRPIHSTILALAVYKDVMREDKE